MKWKQIAKQFWQSNVDPRYTITVSGRKMLYKYVFEVRLEGGRINKTLADFDTKKEAIDYAKEWMKKHPNPEGFRCEQCGRPMNVVDYHINPVCLKCAQENQRRMSRGFK